MFNEGQRAAWVEISSGHIRENYLAIRNLAKDAEVIACIKADAYGHGIVEAARMLAREGAEYLGVATVGEAASIRNAGIDECRSINQRFPNIVLLSPLPRGNIKDAVDLSLIPVVTTYEDAKLLSETVIRAGTEKETPFFISLETGMGRLGFMPGQESLKEIAEIAALPGIRMLGIFSHFATADEPDLSFARAQLGAFNAFDSQLRAFGVHTGKRTMANSAAVMALPESRFEAIRPGITLYGLYPSETMDKSILPLRPAMSVKAHIIYLKKVPAGFSVSYGRRFVTERESLIATLPVGYGDGLARCQSGKARVLIRGRYAPVIGTICMDLCMVDVTDIPGVSEYDEAVIMGEQGGLRISAEEIAANSGTIVYEVVCRFGQRLPRKYIL
jgi:alanine racemase